MEPLRGRRTAGLPPNDPLAENEAPGHPGPKKGAIALKRGKPALHAFLQYGCPHIPCHGLQRMRKPGLLRDSILIPYPIMRIFPLRPAIRDSPANQTERSPDRIRKPEPTREAPHRACAGTNTSGRSRRVAANVLQLYNGYGEKVALSQPSRRPCTVLPL